MKITLKNFRCYENSEFDFGDKGVVLLSGPSGSGKTSVVLGIYFALFGTGNKLVSYGKLSCSVSIEFDGMTITRSKRPNRLVVSTDTEEYEDEAAQSVINNKFGETFETTGYISQNARDSFILMSPIEKLSFLEKFAFHDTDLVQLKKRCSDLIKERNKTLTNTVANLEATTEMLKDIEKPEKVEFPLKCSKKNREKAIKNELIKCKNTKTLISRALKNKQNIEKELHSIQVYKAHTQSKQELLESLLEKIVDLTIKKDKTKYIGNDELEKYEQTLKNLISHRELVSVQERYTEDKKRLDIMKKEELDSITEKIKKIEDNLWKEYTKEESTDTVQMYTQHIKQLEKLGKLNSDLERYTVDEKKIEQYKEKLEKDKIELDINKKLFEKLKMQQEVYCCPSCKSKLRFQDQVLHICDIDDRLDTNSIDNIRTVITSLTKNIKSTELLINANQSKLDRCVEISKEIDDVTKTIQNIIGDFYEEDEEINLSDITNDLNAIKKYVISQENLENKLSTLKDQLANNILSSAIISFENNVTKQKKKLDYLQAQSGDVNINCDEEEIRLIISTEKRNMEQIEFLGKSILSLNKEQEQLNNELEFCKEKHIKMYKKIRKEVELNGELQKISGEISKLQEDKIVYEKNTEKIEQYQAYEIAKEKYSSWDEKLNKLKKDEVEHRKLYGASMLLKEKILEAESIAMLNIVSSINNHTQGYLDCFFPDHPISVKLVPFKETKKGSIINKKPQINIQIEYKSMEADINMLSGGELSRVILAHALALGEMFNTPMMLLDECTSSLDQELTGVVMDGIKEHFEGKLVVVIAHQCILGSYSKVIKLTN